MADTTRCELCYAPLSAGEIAAGSGLCSSCVEKATGKKIVTRKRGNVLLKAHEVINGQRQDQYGNPEDSFQTIADLWSVWLGYEVSARDVAIMMALLKIAREKHGAGKTDNYVDGCGYLALAADMAGSKDA